MMDSAAASIASSLAVVFLCLIGEIETDDCRVADGWCIYSYRVFILCGGAMQAGVAVCMTAWSEMAC